VDELRDGWDATVGLHDFGCNLPGSGDFGVCNGPSAGPSARLGFFPCYPSICYFPLEGRGKPLTLFSVILIPWDVILQDCRGIRAGGWGTCITGR